MGSADIAKALKIGRASVYRVQGPPPDQRGVALHAGPVTGGPIGAMPCDRK